MSGESKLTRLWSFAVMAVSMIGIPVTMIFFHA